MWKTIKNGFKWIADHTGISWVWKQISSGWNWLFGGNDASKANAAKPNGGTPTQSQVPGKNIGKIYGNGISELVLSLEDKNYNMLEYHGTPAKPGEFYVFIKCGDKKFFVTGRLEGTYCIINGVANQGKKVSDDLKTMKDLLGLKVTTTEVKITEFSDVPFIAEVANPEPAANGKVPSSTSANPKQQHVAGNGQKK